MYDFSVTEVGVVWLERFALDNTHAYANLQFGPQLQAMDPAISKRAHFYPYVRLSTKN
jgi:hypothetical protein